MFVGELGSLTKVNVISLLYTFTSAEFGPFSAVSTPIFASKYSFFSIFRDLQNDLIEFSKFCKIFGNFKENSENFHDFSGFSEFFCKISQNFA